MIELIGDRPGHVLEGDEVHHVVVRVEVPFHLDGRPVVVAVDPFATISLVRDEMSRAEHQVILRDPHLVASSTRA